MKKVKEYPKSFDLEIFEEFEKESYKHYTALKRNKISIVPLFIAGVIICAISAFYPWSDILISVMDNFADIPKEASALVSIALSPLMVFIGWLLFIVIQSIILKLTIKPLEVSPDIKGSKEKRIRFLMNYGDFDYESVKNGYSLLDKKLIKEGDLTCGVSLAAIIPFLGGGIYFLITFVRSFLQIGINESYILGLFATAAFFGIINFIPNLITIRVLSRINRRLCGFRKYDSSLYDHIWLNWWPEIDEERAAELEIERQRPKYSDSFLSVSAAAYIRGQQELAATRARHESWMRGE